MEEIKQPPIGLLPRWLWLEQRLDSINEAIDRYKAVNLQVNPEWIDEKLQITEDLRYYYLYKKYQ